MKAAFAHLGWSPAIFWGATPRELAAGLGLVSGPRAVGRGAFEQLMRAYPDETSNAGDGP
ncbi:phage tail assembly chaperone [Roseibium algae]|uniref:Phage tail assembly chaperone n=1 Tax=Roseibium algae TaxID=3123038 RepID=A0ABU8TII0_9HYPH